MGKCSVGLLAVGFVLAAVAPSSGAAISINAALTNPSFELSTGASCPSSWPCSGSPAPGFGSYAPGAAQFVPGSDGLLSGSVPDGTNVAYAPTGLAGSGDLKQTSTAAYSTSNTYEFTFWVGLPLKEPDGTTTVNGYPNTVIVSWLLGTTTAGLCDGWGTATLTSLTGAPATFFDNSADCQFNLPSPGAGQWQRWKLTFNPIFSRSGNLGVDFFVSGESLGQPKEVNFDVDNPSAQGRGITAVPEPASIALLATGVAVWLVRRRPSRQNIPR